jgi:NADH:ubiquinone oxidoreductase subunit E
MIPKGRHTIKICEGTACYVQGSYRIRDFICNEYGLEPGGTTKDRRFSLQVVRCLGACGLAPVMMVDNDTYGKLTIDSVKEILDRYE